jgi:phosphoglycerate dehydrogenase-like enzyme
LRKSRVWIRLELDASELSSLRADHPDVEFYAGADVESRPDLLPSINVVFTDRPLGDKLVSGMAGFRWLHVPRGGAYQFLCAEIARRPIKVTKTRGVHATQIAETGLAYVFCFAKGLSFSRGEDGRAMEKNAAQRDIAGATLGVVGLGAIGAELARKSKALGMTVSACKRTPTMKPTFVDELGGPNYLPTLLAESDFVAVCLPNIASLAGMIGEKELRRMKKSSYLLNLTAKKTVDEPSLVKILKEGGIAGAAMNLLDYEMPPADSELWRLDGLVISPRVIGGSPADRAFMIGAFKENLGRYLRGEELLNQLDKAVGY